MEPGMQETDTGTIFKDLSDQERELLSLIPCTTSGSRARERERYGNTDIDQNRPAGYIGLRARTPGPQELNELLDRAISCVIREITAGHEKELQEKREQAIRIYECQKDFIRALLEHYRDSPENSPVREDGQQPDPLPP